MDNLANALVAIKNCEAIGKKECTVKPASKLIGNVFKIMQKNGYIGTFEYQDNGKAGTYKIQLKGAINNCKAVKPRHSVEKQDFTKWEQRYLPSKTLGILIISTSKGVVTQNEAQELGVGGKILAFVY